MKTINAKSTFENAKAKLADTAFARTMNKAASKILSGSKTAGIEAAAVTAGAACSVVGAVAGAVAGGYGGAVFGYSYTKHSMNTPAEPAAEPAEAAAA